MDIGASEDKRRLPPYVMLPHVMPPYVMRMTARTVLILAGTTASGKSALALEIAEAFDGVIINADSKQVYRELRVISAQPSDADLARAPHRLYGVLAAAERCSAGRWREMAVAEIAAARAARRLAIVVGGTGLYLRALTGGLAPIPPIPDDCREAVRARLADIGNLALHAALSRNDPETAARIEPGDTQRLLRAWEVLEATGKSLSEWRKNPATGPESGFNAATVCLIPPRARINERIDRRFACMIEEGGLDEVRALDGLGLDPELPAMKAHGVPELRRYLHGEIDLAQATAAAQQATRRYAKRQMTWFRHQMPGSQNFDSEYAQETEYSERLMQEIFAFIRKTD